MLQQDEIQLAPTLRNLEACPSWNILKFEPEVDVEDFHPVSMGVEILDGVKHVPESLHRVIAAFTRLYMHSLIN